MANEILNGEYIEELTVNGNKASVEIAKRDARGHIIDKFYLPVARAQEKLISGVNISTINGTPIITNNPTDFQFYPKSDVYKKTEVDYYLNNKISISAVAALPSAADARTNILYLLTTDRSLYIYNTGEWIRVGISLPTVPQESGHYALMCSVSNNGSVQYSWGNASAISNPDNPNPDEPPVVEHHLSTIYIQTKPRKLVYELNEEFSIDGIVVKAVYTDSDTDINVTNDIVVIDTPDMSVAGEQTIYISYTDENDEYAEAWFKITINAPVEEITDLEDGENACVIDFTTADAKDGTQVSSAIVAGTHYAISSQYSLDNIVITPTQSISALSTYGLKLGSSSKNGAFTISFDSETVKTVHIYAHVYGTNKTKIKLVDSTDTEQIYAFDIGDDNETTGDADHIDAETGIHDIKFSIGKNISSLAISTTNKRAYVSSIKITTDNE